MPPYIPVIGTGAKMCGAPNKIVCDAPNSKNRSFRYGAIYNNSSSECERTRLELYCSICIPLDSLCEIATSGSMNALYIINL